MTDMPTATSGIGALAVDRSARNALIALFAGALAIALSPIFVRAVLGEVGPTAAAFWRTALAVPLLWLWLAFEPRDNRPKVRGRAGWRDYATLLLAGLFFAGDLVFWHLSINYTTIANSTLLANFAPIYVAIVSFLLFGERFSGIFVTGLALAVAGAAVLMGDSVAIGAEHLLGDALGLVTGMFYAGYILTVGRLRTRFTTARIMTWSAIATSVFVLPLALLSGEPMLPGTLFGWSMLL
ncbi:MAG TPA: DMT family transporter, partial [Alphaproteobacteria bacterium]|nr:DMT family transporter [Alphaproteobacteria bacterium]